MIQHLCHLIFETSWLDTQKVSNNQNSRKIRKRFYPTTLVRRVFGKEMSGAVYVTLVAMGLGWSCWCWGSRQSSSFSGIQHHLGSKQPCLWDLTVDRLSHGDNQPIDFGPILLPLRQWPGAWSQLLFANHQWVRAVVVIKILRKLGKSITRAPILHMAQEPKLRWQEERIYLFHFLKKS